MTCFSSLSSIDQQQSTLRPLTSDLRRSKSRQIIEFFENSPKHLGQIALIVSQFMIERMTNIAVLSKNIKSPCAGPLQPISVCNLLPPKQLQKDGVHGKSNRAI
jgi:hypothetical protein